MADIASVTGVAKADIETINNQNNPADDIVTTNLIAHWDYSNSSCYSGSGTSFTDLASSEVGSLVNGPTYSSSAPQHFSCDGVNDYIENGIANTFGTAHSIEVWFKAPDFTGQKRLAIVRSYQSNCTSTNGGYAFQYLNTGTLQFILFNIATYTSSSITVNTNTWYCMACTINGSTLKFYQNGSLVSTHTISTSRTVPCSTGLKVRHAIVSSNTGGVNLTSVTTSDIAELRIYTSELSGTEITSNYDARKARYGY